MAGKIMEMISAYSSLLFCLCAVHGISTEFTTIRGEQREHVLNGYKKNVRPAEMTTVNVTLALTSLKKLDIGSQTLSTTFYLHLSWFDDRLVWTPKNNYSDYFLYEINEIWTPNFVIDNFIEDNGLVGIFDDGPIPLRVSHTGIVLWILRISTTTTCQVDITYYPYDTQTCHINITEWAYTSTEVNLVPETTDYYPDTVYIGSYTEDGEWALKSRAVHEQDIVGGFGLLYKNLQYTFEFKRRPTWYIPILMIPLGLMSILMSGVFLVPVESGEKMAYCLTVMLSFTVTLSFISSTLPSVSNTFSIIGVYVAIVMVTSCFVVVLTAIVLYLHHKEDNADHWKGWAKRVDEICLTFFSIFFTLVMITFAACFNNQTLDAVQAVCTGTIVPFVIGVGGTVLYTCCSLRCKK